VQQSLSEELALGVSGRFFGLYNREQITNSSVKNNETTDTSLSDRSPAVFGKTGEKKAENLQQCGTKRKANHSQVVLKRETKNPDCGVLSVRGLCNHFLNFRHTGEPMEACHGMRGEDYPRAGIRGSRKRRIREGETPGGSRENALVEIEAMGPPIEAYLFSPRKSYRQWGAAL